ncbi:MAG TPA: hypothetical protein DD671_17010, partial [Balneolaceae bacterium]|nr:hypothetical protein [Balneolaceae bacterium]
MNDSFEKLEKDLENFESESPYKTVDILKEQIEDMLEDGFSEERVWKACKLDMQKFDIEIEKNSLVIDRIEMLLTNRIGHFKSKEICEKFQKICIQRIDDYKTCKELVRNFKKRYCKSILTTTP